MLPSQAAIDEMDSILGNYFDYDLYSGVLDAFANDEDMVDALARSACDTYEYGDKTSGTQKTFGICSPFEIMRDLATAAKTLKRRSDHKDPVQVEADSQHVKDVLAEYGVDNSNIAVTDIFITSMIYPLCKYDLFPDSYFGEITFYDNGFEYDWEL